MYINQIIEKCILSPRKLFLIDGFGAILSAFLLGVVLVKFESYIGIPASTLYFLASLPIFFAIYDFYCLRKKNADYGKVLKGISIINFLYCCLSIGFSFYHLETITPTGWAYVLIEVLIVMFIATIEFKVAKKLIA